MNRQVREYFSDVGGETWQSDISTPRASLRTACTHQERDTVNMTMLRMMTFYFTIRGVEQGINSGDDTGSLGYAVMRKSQPKLTLHFSEDDSDADQGYRPVIGEISFRLMNHSSTSLSKAEATAYGNKIKTAFGGSTPFVWRKGKLMASYSDWEKGYQLQLLVPNDAEGRRVVEQVLDINSHTPDWKNYATKENGAASSAYPTVPPTQSILGKSTKLPRRRPTASVKFRYATLAIAGLSKRLCLYDSTYKFKEALVKN